MVVFGGVVGFVVTLGVVPSVEEFMCGDSFRGAIDVKDIPT